MFCEDLMYYDCNIKQHGSHGKIKEINSWSLHLTNEISDWSLQLTLEACDFKLASHLVLYGDSNSVIKDEIICC